MCATGSASVLHRHETLAQQVAHNPSLTGHKSVVARYQITVTLPVVLVGLLRVSYSGLRG